MRTIQAPQRKLIPYPFATNTSPRSRRGFYPPPESVLRSPLRERIDEYLWDTKRVWTTAFFEAAVMAEWPKLKDPIRFFWREPGFSWLPRFYRFRQITVLNAAQRSSVRAPLSNGIHWTPGIAYMPMLEHKFTTLAETTTTADPGSGGTSLAVTTRTGFPQAGKFYLLVQDSETSKTNREIMRVTGGWGTGAGSFTVVRGQEGTTGVAHASGSYVALVLVATSLELSFVRCYGADLTYYSSEASAHSGTDSTSALQAAFDLANTAGGGRVKVGEGYVRLVAQITGRNRVALHGEGLDKTVFVRDDAVNYGFSAQPSVWDNTKTNLCGVVNQSDRGVFFLTAVSGSFLVGQDAKISGGTMTSFGVTDKMPTFVSRIENIVNGSTTATGVNGLNSATVNVGSTASFADRGWFLLGGVATSYTGKTATSFTGCGNHAATTGGEAITSFGILFAESIPWGQYPLADGTRPTTVSSSNAGLWTNVDFRGFTIKQWVTDELTIPTNAISGIALTAIKNSVISDVKFQNFSSAGINIPGDCRNVKVRDSDFYRCTSGDAGASGFAYFATYSTRMSISDCNIERCAQGVTMQQCCYGKTTDNQVSGCFGIVSATGIATDASGRGIKYMAGHAFGIISDNNLSDDADNSLRLADTNNCMLSGNTMHHAAGTTTVGGRAIQLDSNTINDGTFSYDNVVSSNIMFWSGGPSCYTAMPDTIIMGNIFDGANKLTAGVADTYINSDNCTIQTNRCKNYGTGNYGIYTNTSRGAALIANNRVSNGSSGVAIRTDTGSGANTIEGNYTVGENNVYHATDLIDGWRTTRLTSDVTKTTTAATDVTGLFIYCSASDVMRFEFRLNVLGGTGGVKLALTFPAGATIKATARGESTGVTAMTSERMTASGTLTTAAFCTSVTGDVIIWGEIVNSTTAGNVQLQYGSGTNGQTATIQSLSHAAGQPIK